MNEYEKLIEYCGMDLKGAARLIGITHIKSRKWACGVQTPDPEAVAKLSKLSKQINNIFGARDD